MSFSQELDDLRERNRTFVTRRLASLNSYYTSRLQRIERDIANASDPAFSACASPNTTALHANTRPANANSIPAATPTSSASSPRQDYSPSVH